MLRCQMHFGQSGENAAMIRRLWNWWKRTARKIGSLQARIILTVFYFFCLGPFALLLRWRSDPLLLKPSSDTGWRARFSSEKVSMEEALRQF